MSRSEMLRFTEEELADRQARRQRFQGGKVRVAERDVLSAAIELLKRHPAVAWAMRSNVGVGYLLRADVYQRLVREGHLSANEARFMRFGVKGAADITGMLRGGRRLEIECKSDTGKPTDDQIAFGEAVNGGGGLWFVARSVDDVMKNIGTPSVVPTTTKDRFNF